MAKLCDEFPPVSTAEWEAQIRSDLKGADYEKKLVWRSPEGIAVRPYYRSDDIAGLHDVPSTREGNDWEIADQAPPDIDVDAGRFEESGASVIQEIGYAIAQGIDLVSDRNPARVVFSFALGSSYFFQIAKLRAFRMLWARATEVMNKPALATVIHCRTSRWNKSIYDSYNNVLRATTEAMSAAIGGADLITVEPFDSTYREPGAAARRLARNTQLILKHEALLDRVGDPAAGSYYIEWLTDALAREAWKLMQQIDEFGGFAKAYETGMIPAAIAESRGRREAAVAERRRVFVGVNQYPNLSERMLDHLQSHHDDAIRRGPEIFEELRLRVERMPKTPRILLAEFGDFKMSKARSQFVMNFFGCAGFEIDVHRFDRIEDAAAVECDAIVLCSADGEYLDGMTRLRAALGDRTTPVIVAGFPKDAIEALKAAGAADFVHLKSNAAATLAAWVESFS